MDINQNSLDFLLFSCLSLSVNTLISKEADYILGLAIKRAYRDASSHVLTVNKDSDPRILESSDMNPDKIIADAVLELEKSDDYDTWHCNLCKRLCNAYSICSNCNGNDEERVFRFGIAQKWVNMTMKYITLLYDICSKCELKNSKFFNKYRRAVEKHRDALHAPVDRYIINAAWNCQQISLPLKKEEEKGKRLNRYKDPSDYVKAWSKWNCVDYCKFQNSLRAVLQNEHPGKKVLAWENEVWILEAEKINKQPERKGNNNV